MKIIAHRGNLNGPDPVRENKLWAVEDCLNKGYDVEIDVWYAENEYYLGHDGPSEVIPFTTLARKGVWVHAKTPETFAHLASFGAPGIWSMINAFFHTDEDVVLTTRGYLWCHGKYPMPGKRSVIMYPSAPEHMKTFAICTDNPESYLIYKEEDASLPKLILLDVDGVLTNGRKSYARDGSVTSKQFCDRDFTAIKRFQAAGVEVALISGDISNRQMVAFKRQLRLFNTNFRDKIELLPEICAVMEVEPKDILFVGDDYYDVALLSAVGHPYCPGDAIADVQQVAYILPVGGGDGLVAELYGLLRNKLEEGYPVDSAGVNP